MTSPVAALTTETFLTLLANPPDKISMIYELNAIAPQLMQHLRDVREMKDDAIVTLANRTSRQLQWQQRSHLEFATLLLTYTQRYNQQIFEDTKVDCAYYAKLTPLVQAILGRIKTSPLSEKNKELVENTCRYFLLGHSWSGIDTEHLLVKYVSPEEGWNGCWEARRLKWNYPFRRL